ncbi:hypothetical protein NXS19_002744 [Fusarium pseudograminearum]|uniref:lytic cellulose monooxygenase (C4-dehydrogenating) n=1 Tax=Fusarium pseudograminearum (strain CS3096) TaxID=1028729 RepID=K3VWC4_FUSPC|nr:hypothetical protein FPSE_00619 [Fusarium pseudograminearum CS3096]EKJ79308.1 hypothetical protein FPSE_00619 [Fusarium pseudograminearum CS3096]UZP34928.1 hypothetical protein NXS19_002744 [Fusarium pseudograminearum]
MSSFITKTVLAALVAAAGVRAHGHVESITVGGTEYEGLNPGAAAFENPRKELAAWFATNTDNGFVEPSAFGDADIICHRGAENAVKSAKVKAGEKITIKWDTWPESHKGPVIDYLASCGSGGCAKVDKTSLKFFKIAEAGMTSGGKFASDDLIAAGNTWEVTVPTSIKAGNYVLRHEIIALHAAGQKNGAQNYPQCFNLEVESDGTAEPAGVAGTSLYTDSEKGIVFDLYNNPTSYPIPGPKMNIAGGSSGAAPSTPATPTTGSGSDTPSNTAAPVESAPASSAPAESAAPVESAPAADNGNQNNGGASPVETEAPATPQPTKTGCKAKKARRHARDMMN